MAPWTVISSLGFNNICQERNMLHQTFFSVFRESVKCGHDFFNYTKISDLRCLQVFFSVLGIFPACSKYIYSLKMFIYPII
jgi:hypothetical protein